MKKRKLVNKKRQRRAQKVRAGTRGSSETPRLSVFRSHKNIYVQLIDDSSGKTLASVSSYKMKEKDSKKSVARKVGESIAEEAKNLGVEKVIFDRGSYKYHGRVAEVAKGARSKGLKF